MDSYEKKLKVAVEALELPPGAYESAVERYKSLGEWFSRAESSLSSNDPHIFAQGSFALGTAIRPLLDGESYDLDLACKLRDGVSRQAQSQAEVKKMVGQELEGYREAKRIKENLEEKHRCWRLYYQDGLSFHMDVVPCIPADEGRRKELAVAMESHGFQDDLAHDVASLAVYITDDRSSDYERKSEDWLLSNPDGFCKWFESRSLPRFQEGVYTAEARVDEVPFHHKKTNLQRAIQLLKRHRDVMFKDAADSKPISVIITTLAAHYYTPGGSLADAVTMILAGLQRFVISNSDEVLNPVNPEENFADRWHFPECKHLQLKGNFHLWVRQAGRDFSRLKELDAEQPLGELLNESFNVKVGGQLLESIAGLASSLTTNTEPTKVHVSSPPSPWSN